MKGDTMFRTIILLLTLFLYTHAQEKVIINYPLTSNKAQRDNYHLSLLKFLLEKVNIDYTIKPTKTIYTQARAIKELKKGDKVNIFWMGTSPQLETELIPIRFPMYRGLVGHRIFIINKNDQKMFNHVKNLVQLQKFKGIQGIGWSDVAILESAGLKQHTAKYENIFKMINRGGRVGYFSRSINEAYEEIEVRDTQLKNLTVEKNIVLVYPFAMFFFVSPKHEYLAKKLNEAFLKSYKDGSFLEFFYKHPKIKLSIEKSKLNNRKRIEIPNPFLTPQTANINSNYWHGKFIKEQ